MSFGRFYRHSLGLRILVVIVCLLTLQEPRLLIIPQYVAQGNDALRNGNPTLAINVFRTALAAKPGDTYLLERLVDSTLAAQRPDMAAIFLQQLTALAGWEPASYRKMATILTAQAKSDQAAFYWEASLVGTKDDIPALTTLSDRAIATQDWTTATDLLTRIVNLDPNNKKSQHALGLLLLPTNQNAALAALESASTDTTYELDVATIRTALQNASQNPDTLHRQIGLTLIGLQAWPYAEHALSLALAQGDNSPATLAFLGVAQDQQGRDGWPAINQAITAAPQDGLVNYAAALHWQLRGDLPKALAALIQAQSVQPNNPAIAAEIGHVYDTQGSLDNAAIWLNTAVALAPDNVGFHTLLAKFYAQSQFNLGGAGLDSIHRLTDQYPDVSDIHASLGWGLYSTGQIDLARTEFERAVSLDPGNARAQYYLAVVQEQRKDVQGAIVSYRAAYRVDGPFKGLSEQALKRLGSSVP